MAGCLEADGSRTKRESWEHLVVVNIYICGHNTWWSKVFQAQYFLYRRACYNFLWLLAVRQGQLPPGGTSSSVVSPAWWSNRKHFTSDQIIKLVNCKRWVIFLLLCWNCFLFRETNFMKMTWKFFEFLWWVLFWFYSDDL